MAKPAVGSANNAYSSNSSQRSWPQIEAAGIKFGLSRGEVNQLLRRRFPSGASNKDALSFLNDEFDVAGYKQYVSTLTPEDRQYSQTTQSWDHSESAMMSIASWQNLPEHLRQRRMYQRSMTEFDPVDNYGNYELPKKGYMRRKNEAYAFKTESVTRASHIGHDSNGNLLPTFASDKMNKRLQLLGAHSMVRLNQQGVSAPKAAAMRAGPQSRRPEQIQTARAALIIGGSPGASGQFLLNTQGSPASSYASRRITKTVWGDSGKDFDLTGLNRGGARYAAGKGIQLADQLSPVGVGSKWQHRLVGHEKIFDDERNRWGYRFAIEQSAPSETALIRSKAFGMKAVGTQADLSGWQDEAGNPLNVQVAGELKDYSGAAYSHFMSRGREYMVSKAREHGVAIPEGEKGRSYAELGSFPLDLMSAMIQAKDQSLVQTIRAPIRGPGGKTTMREMQALVEDFGFQFSSDDPVRSPRLSADEMASLKRHDPVTYNRIANSRRSRSISGAYRQTINAALASTGRWAMPAHTVSGDSPTVRRRIEEVLGRSQTAARASMPDLDAGSPIPKPVLMKHFTEEWGKQRYNLNIGGTVLPPGRSMQRFAAGGVMSNEEVSRMANRTYNLLSAYSSGDQGKLKDASGEYRSHMARVAGGQRTLDNAQSAFPSRKDMLGTVVRGSEALMGHEVYVPGMGGQAVHMARFPTQGGMEYSMTLRSLTDKEALSRGLNLESLYTGHNVQQALAGDYDGDLVYAIRAGAVQVDKAGNLVLENGKKLTNAAQVKMYADQAVKRNAGNLAEENALLNPLTKKEAIAQAIQGLQPTPMPEKVFMGEVGKGEWRQRAIGEYFNNYRRGMETAPLHAKDAMQTLFNISHGTTQRPQELPPELQAVHDLMTFNIKSGGYFQREKQLGAKSAPSFEAMRRDITPALINAKHEKYGHYLSDMDAANLLTTPDKAEAASKLINQYRQNADPETLNQLYKLNSTGEWVTKTGMGRMLGGRAVIRGIDDKGMTMEQVASRNQVGMQVAERLLGYGRQGEQAIKARQHPRTGSMSEDELMASLEERVMAARSSQGANLVEPLAAQHTPTPAATASTRTRRGSHRGGVLVGAGDAGGGIPLVPPSGGSPPSGGGGGKPPSDAFFGDDFYPQRPGGDRPQNPRGDRESLTPFPVISAGKLGDVNTLLAAFDSGKFDDELARARAIDASGLLTPQMKKLTQAAGRVYPNLQQQIREAYVIQDQGTPVQKELAGEFLASAESLEKYHLDTQLRQAFDVNNFNQENLGMPIAGVKATQRRQALAKSGRRMSGVRGEFGAQRFGRDNFMSFASREDIEMFGQVEQIQGLRNQYMEKRSQYATMSHEKAQALEQGGWRNNKRARELEVQMAPLAESMKDLRTQFGNLTPAVKSHIEILKDQNTVTKEGVELQKRSYTALETRLSEINRQISSGDIDRASPEGKRLVSERYRTIGAMQVAEKERLAGTSRLAAGRELAGEMGDATRSLPGQALRGRQAPRSMIEKIGQNLATHADPQKLFYRGQMLAQGYYMLGMPMMQAREEYIQSRMTEGRLEVALGAQQMPADIQKLQRQQAQWTTIKTQFGEGVNEVVSPLLDWLSQKAETPDSRNIQNAGRVGATAFGVGMGAAGLSMLPGGRALMKGVLGNPTLMGVAAGVGGYEYMRSQEIIDPERYDTTSGIVRNTAGALVATGGLRTQQILEKYNIGTEEQRAAGSRRVGDVATTFSREGLLAGFKDAFSGGSVSRARAAAELAPKNLQQRLVDLVGGQITEEQASQFATVFADTSGLPRSQIEGGKGFDILSRMVGRGVGGGFDTQQLLNFIGQAPAAGGFMPGSKESLPLLDYLSKFSDLTDAANRQQALSAVSGTALQFGMDVESLPGLAEMYKGTAKTKGGFRAQRQLSQLFGGNVYDYSDNIRRITETQTRAGFGSAAGTTNQSGIDIADLAIVDEQGRPRYQQEGWDIQDRQHSFDFQQSQQRGNQQLEWTKEEFELNKQMADFKRESKEKDFALSQRQYEISIKQMKHNIALEEERAKVSKQSYEQQHQISRQMFELQGQYKVEDFATQEGRMQLQNAWAIEDQAFAREGFELQAGWQEEDLKRAERYSTGRQRMDIQRQRERALIMNDRQRESFDRQEERTQTKFDWSVEDLETAKTRFEEMRALQEQMMELQHSSWQQNTELAEKDREFRKEMMVDQMQMMEDRKADAEWRFEKSKEFEDQQRTMNEEQTAYRIQWQEMDLAEAVLREEEYQKQTEHNRQMSLAQQNFNMAQTIGWKDASEKSEEIKLYWDKIYEKAVGAAAAFGGGQEENLPYNNGDASSQAGFYSELLQSVIDSNKGTITIDLDSIHESGFVHVNDFNDIYWNQPN